MLDHTPHSHAMWEELYRKWPENEAIAERLVNL